MFDVAEMSQPDKELLLCPSFQDSFRNEQPSRIENLTKIENAEFVKLLDKLRISEVGTKLMHVLRMFKHGKF